MLAPVKDAARRVGRLPDTAHPAEVEPAQVSPTPTDNREERRDVAIQGCRTVPAPGSPPSGCAETHGEAARENEVRGSTGPVSAVAGQLLRTEGLHRVQDVEGEDR